MSAFALEDRLDTDCPSCGRRALEAFYGQDAVPSHSCLLLDSADEARRFPRGSIRLAVCRACGMITNTAFDARLSAYSTRYEETQGFSPRFNAFARALAERLVETYAVRGKDVLEIGCGKGEFLAMVCELGGNRGVGIDPSVVPERVDAATAERVTFIQDYYSERYAHLTGDLVLCRHTLEHIHATGAFLRLLRSSLEGRHETIVCFELPDVMRVLREVAFWDIYYEHCSYFTCGSLARLFRAHGFEVLDLTLDFDDQYAIVECRPAPAQTGVALPIEESPADVLGAVERFRHELTSGLEHWRSELGSADGDRGGTVVWGAGSKGVAFLTTLGIEREVRFAVDINPYKHGKHIAGTGQETVPPERLREIRPDTVIAMNPIYRDEIQASLDSMEVDARLIAV